MENITTAARNKMALTYGLIVGLIYVAITTVINMALVNNMVVFYTAKSIGYILYFIAIGLFVKQIRKANGGYIEFREAFGVVFIILLIAGLMSYLYNYLYIDFIDKQFMNKIKNAAVSFMEHGKMPVSKIEETERNFEEQAAAAKTLNLGKNILTFSGAIILDSLFGLIVCAIIKRPKPMFDLS